MQITCHNSEDTHFQSFIVIGYIIYWLIIRHMRLIIRQRQSYFLSQWKVCINAYLLFHFSYFAQAIAHISTENSIFASSFQLNKLFYLW